MNVTFFQRILAHLEDNLLTVASEIHHDGQLLATEEVMPPTTPSLAVYIWLLSIDSRLLLSWDTFPAFKHKECYS